MTHLLHLTIAFDSFLLIAYYDGLCIDWHMPICAVSETFSLH